MSAVLVVLVVVRFLVALVTAALVFIVERLLIPEFAWVAAVLAFLGVLLLTREAKA